MNFQCHVCNGGASGSVGEDIRKLEYGQHVLGTPGRVFGMMQKRKPCTRNVKILVLDEASELLDGGFKDQIYEVYRCLPPATQVVLPSSTLSSEVLEMTKFMTNLISILIKRDGLVSKGIKRFFVAVEKGEWKFGTLCGLYDVLTVTRVVIRDGRLVVCILCKFTHPFLPFKPFSTLRVFCRLCYWQGWALCNH